MGKYTAPQVTILDIAQALPALEQPLLWRVALYPKAGNTTNLHACVELCVARPDSSTIVYKRFAGKARSSSTASVLAGLLQAAQEAYWYTAPISPGELVRLACWEADAPRP